MRGQHLRELLAKVTETLHASGAPKQGQAFGELTDALEQFDALELKAVFDQVEASAASAVAPAWLGHLDALKAAELDEKMFLEAISALEEDKSIKKSDLVKIVAEYVGSVDRKVGVEGLHRAIRSRFYNALNARDANEMAKRATPW